MNNNMNNNINPTVNEFSSQGNQMNNEYNPNMNQGPMPNPGFNPNMNQGPMPNPGFNPNMNQGPMPNPGFNPNMNQGPMPNPGFNPNMNQRPMPNQYNRQGVSKIGLIIGEIVGVVAIVIVCIFLFGGKKMTCTISESQLGVKMDVVAKFSARGKRTYGNVEFTLSSSSYKFSEEEAKTIEASLINQYGDLEGLKHSVKVNDGKVIVTLSGTDSSNISEVKDQLVAAGYTCN